jgi:uncharacterized protein
MDYQKIIKRQLGREPDNLGGVARYCPSGKPAVLLTLPYSRQQGVFPTTYWLSCPYLVKEVSRLEDEGLIKSLTSRLNSDTEFKKALDNAHERYAKKRFSLLSDDYLEELNKESPSILQILRHSGIGGIRNKGIKCLHAHLADYLVGAQNPVGEAIWQSLGWPDNCNIC